LYRLAKRRIPRGESGLPASSACQTYCHRAVAIGGGKRKIPQKGGNPRNGKGEGIDVGLSRRDICLRKNRVCGGRRGRVLAGRTKKEDRSYGDPTPERFMDRRKGGTDVSNSSQGVGVTPVTGGRNPAERGPGICFAPKGYAEKAGCGFPFGDKTLAIAARKAECERPSVFV